MIEAFKSTLEEVRFSDLILCVYDCSAIILEKQRNTISEVLKILSSEEKPRLDVYNKIDLLSPEDMNILRSKNPEGLFVSASTGEGLAELKESLRKTIYENAVASR